MLKNRDVVCVSSIDWDFIRQGHQEIMSALASNGNRVLFIENTGVRAPNLKDLPRMKRRISNWFHSVQGIRKEADNLYIYSPLILPFPYSKIAVKINKLLMCSVIKRWMKAVEFRNPIVWSFLPTRIVLEILEELAPSIFVYYCIDNFEASSKGARKIRRTEEKVISRADLVFTTAHKLYKRCAAINSNTYLFPFGVNIAPYNKVRESVAEKPADLKMIKGPIIGYIGGLHKWVDFKLVRAIALARKDISIVMIGPKQTDLAEIEGLDNVFILGKKKHEDLPIYAKFFDAGIIPYRVTSYTENVYPTKINEYLAMGKPVISTAIPEVVAVNEENGRDFIYFIKEAKDIDRIMGRVLSGESKEMLQKRIEMANQNSWEHKIEAMCALIEKRSEEMRLRFARDWTERFRMVYRRISFRATKIVLAAALAYLVVFYTPLVWFLASPLKIDQMPQKSDCIVVFGGGVGESGKAGEGYEERVGYAVELYKKGYAGHIIFSSGYKYIFNETLLMKSLAVTLGVPEEAVVLDDRARNTFEHVQLTADITRQKGWHRILLVTSPYNTLRASLIFNKYPHGLRVIYTPLPHSIFYAHQDRAFSRQATVRQIKGIIHEYLGIAYYKYKGWI